MIEAKLLIGHRQEKLENGQNRPILRDPKAKNCPKTPTKLPGLKLARDQAVDKNWEALLSLKFKAFTCRENVSY
jgi:hypothetical protein